MSKRKLPDLVSEWPTHQNETKIDQKKTKKDVIDKQKDHNDVQNT